MESFLQRFDKVILYAGSAYKLANDIGSSEAVISNIRSGKTKPSYDFLSKLLKKYEVIDLNWLMTGEGEMIKIAYKNAHTPTITQLKEPENDFKKHIPYIPHDSFVTDDVTNQSRKPSKTPENNENPNVPKNQNTEEYNRLLEAKNEVITSLREQIEGLLREVDKAEQIAHEKERVIQAIQSQNPHQQQPSSKQTRRTG